MHIPTTMPGFLTLIALVLLVRLIKRLTEGSRSPSQNSPARSNAPVWNTPPVAAPPPVPRSAVGPPLQVQPRGPIQQKTVGLTQLTGGDFQPLSPDQVRAKAATMTRGTGWGFDSFSVIPSADDERIKLIDQGMVGLGLITPEQLAEIHKVGLEMDEARPQIIQAHQKANIAVQQDKAARAEQKAQKKAEAAQRKADRAAAIEQRRQTDIIFLGRGVSGGLADRRTNVEKLQKWALPLLATPTDVAQALGLTIPTSRPRTRGVEGGCAVMPARVSILSIATPEGVTFSLPLAGPRARRVRGTERRTTPRYRPNRLNPSSAVGVKRKIFFQGG